MSSTLTAFTPRWIVLILTLLVLAGFHKAGRCDFILLDDGSFVYDNPNIRDGITWKSLQWAVGAGLLFDSPNADYWQPTTLVARMAIVHVFGLNPAMHHLINLGIHLLNVLLLWHVLRKMTGSVMRSALIAAFFAIHPLRVESVVWITEIKDLLSGLFFLLTIWAYLRYVARPGFPRYLAVAGCFALALMSKPMAVTLPVVLLILDFWPLQRAKLENRSISTWARLVLEKTPLFGLALTSGLLTLMTQSRMLGVTPEIPAIIHILASYGLYIRQILFPTSLAVHYPPLKLSIAIIWAAFSALLLVGMTLISFRQRVGRPFLLTGWAWFVITLMPVVGLSDLTTADRFTYIPFIGFMILVVWGGDSILHTLVTCRGWNLGRVQRQALAGCALLLGVLAWMTHTQTFRWRDSIALFEHSLNITGEDYFAHTILGEAYLRQGQLNRSLYHRIRAVQMSPRSPETHVLLANTLLQKENFSEAIDEFRQALKLSPNNPSNIYNLLGNAFLRQGKSESAHRAYLSALQLNPRFAEAHYNLANLLTTQGKMSDAIFHYCEAIRLKPDYPMAHYNLGICLVQTSKPQEGLSSLKIALTQQPEFEPARQAIADLEKHGIR